MRAFDYFTQACYAAFGDRKRQGRTSILVDTRTGNVLCVPRNEEHIAFAGRVLHGADSVEAYAHLVPSHIDLDFDGNVSGVITGVSGLEIGLGVRHSRAQLNQAHERALRFVAEGEFGTCDELESTINFKYATK